MQHKILHFNYYEYSKSHLQGCNKKNCKIILGKVKYPKYDSVVSHNLFYYYNKYVDENSNKNENTYKINSAVKKIDEYINKYLLYTNDINNIVEKVQINNEFSDFNIEDLDHII